jgi:hypothetical protein
MEALNTHLQLLNIYASTRSDISQIDHTAKTSRGWWIVWNRQTRREIRYRSTSEHAEASGRRGSDADHGSQDAADGSDEPTPTEEIVVTKEVFLVRKSGDHGGGVRGVSASHIAPGAGTGSGNWADGAGRLAQGIGVDTRRYIEGLLNLT